MAGVGIWFVALTFLRLNAGLTLFVRSIEPLAGWCLWLPPSSVYHNYKCVLTTVIALRTLAPGRCGLLVDHVVDI